MKPTLALTLAAVLAVAACERQGVNPPTDPAEPIPIPPGEAPPSAPSPGGGAGAASFVGRWAARAGWCANTTGPERPIEITIQRFEGYENSCAITSLDQVDRGYEATLACEAEGTASRERIRLTPQGEGLRLTWLDRNDAVVNLVRCPAPTEAPVTPESEPAA